MTNCNELRRTKTNECLYVCNLDFVGSVIFIRNDGMTIRSIVLVDFFIFCSLNRLICEELTIILITEWNH